MRRHQCAYCGEDMGLWNSNCDRNDTCGKPECERWARDCAVAEREEAHAELDRERGWDR